MHKLELSKMELVILEQDDVSFLDLIFDPLYRYVLNLKGLHFSFFHLDNFHESNVIQF